MSLHSSRRRVTGTSSAKPGQKIKKAALHVVETLESRRLLDATQQFINTWEHLGPVARHDLAVLETIYPEATARLDAYVESLGLAPIEPEAGTLSSIQDAKGRFASHHRKPQQHPKSHAKHHGRGGGAAPTASVTYNDDFKPNEVTINFDQTIVPPTNWNSAISFVNLTTHTSFSPTQAPVNLFLKSASSTSLVYDLNVDANDANPQPLTGGNYAVVIDGSQIVSTSGSLELVGSDGVPGDTYIQPFAFHNADVNNDGVVNSADLQTVLSDFNQSVSRFTQGDTNYSGIVNSSDLQTVLAYFNLSFTPLTTPTTPYVTSATNNSIQIAWTCSDIDATSFDIYRDSSYVTNLAHATSFNDMGVSGNHSYFIVARSDSNNTSYPSGVLRASTAPQAMPSFVTDTLPQKLTFQFNQNMTAVHWDSALTVINLNSRTTVVPTTWAYASDTHILTYSFSPTLADANYAAILHSQLIISDYGIPLAGSDNIAGDDYTFPFDFLQGDITGAPGNPSGPDRQVDSTDLAAVNSAITNQPAPITYGKGDIDFSGAFDSNDATLEGSLSGHTLPLLDNPSDSLLQSMTANNITLQWTSTDSRVSSFDVYRDYAFLANTTGATYSDDTAQPNTSYTYFVVAKDTTGDSSFPTAELSQKTASPLPATPTNLSAQATATTILLSWADSSSPPLTFNVFRDGTQIATGLTAVSFLDTGLTPNSFHTYTVQAVNSAGTSAQSASVSQSTSSAPAGYSTSAPRPATGVTAGPDPTGKSIVISWSPSPDASTEIITYEVDRDGVALDGTTGTSYTDATALTGVTYSYTVTAYDPSFNASPKASATSTPLTDQTAPNTPLDLQVTQNDGTNVTLSWVQPWDDVGVTSYNIYRDYQLVKNTPDTTYTDTTAAPDADYTYYVAAVDTAGHNANSSFPPAGSASITVTTPGGQVTPIDSSPSQYITPAWQNDFYNNLTPILRNRIAAIPNVYIPDPSAQFWYDPTDTIISGSLPTTGDTTQIQGTTGTYCYLDSHGTGSWTMDRRRDSNNQPVNDDDPVWQDVDHTGIYHTGEPIVDWGNGTLRDGMAGKTNGIFSTTLSTGTFIWKASTTSFSQDFANFYTGLNAVLPYYASGGPDIDNPSSTRLSPALVLQGLYGQNFQTTTIPNDTLTITESSPGSYRITDTANSLTTELKPGDNILLGTTWYPIDYNACTSNTIALMRPYRYVGSTGPMALTVCNWTLVPSFTDTGTGASFTYERGIPSTLLSTRNLVFQQQFAELHAALGQLNTLAPFYDQADFATRSAQFISVASDVINAYAAVFGIADPTSLEQFILDGNADPGAVEEWTLIDNLRSMIDSIESRIYVRGGPSSSNGWVTDPYGNPITFARDTQLLQTLLPRITNIDDQSIVIRQPGEWSNDSFGTGPGTGSPIDPTHLTELETILHAMETGAGMTMQPVGSPSPIPVPDQMLWIKQTSGAIVQGELDNTNGSGQMDHWGGLSSYPAPPQVNGEPTQQYDVQYAAMPNPSPHNWNVAPPGSSQTGQVVQVATVSLRLGSASFFRSLQPSQNIRSDGTQLLDTADLYLSSGSIWLLVPNQNPNGNDSDLGSVMAAPTSGQQLDTSSWQAGHKVMVIQWTEDEALGDVLANWQEPESYVDGPLDTTSHLYRIYHSFVNAPNGVYANDNAYSEVDAIVNDSDYPDMYTEVVLPNPLNYTPDPTKPGAPGMTPPPRNWKPLLPMPTVNGGPTAPFPLTTRMDYENTTPDTNMDGIVQVPADLASLGNDTGVMAFQADRNDPQAFLPIFTDITGAFPIHGYLQQGAFSTTGADGNPLLSDELAGLYSDQMTLPDGVSKYVVQYVSQAGLPYAYSLDTYTRINELLDDGVNHVKRIEVIRPGGNAVVFDFPWNPNTNSFSLIGTPLGYLVNGVGRDANRTYVLRDLTTTDASESSEAGGTLHKYALEFSSGITQTFAQGSQGKGAIDSVSNAQGLKQDLSSYLTSTASGAQFNKALANNTTDTLDSSRYNITLNLYNNANTPAYRGRIESIDYQTITPSGVAAQTIHTAITYNSSNAITALNKTSSGSPIDAFSYSIDANGAIARDGVTVSRTGTFTNGAAGTVTITTNSTDSTLAGSLAEAVTFNSDGLVTTDAVTLDEGNGNPTQTAATTYAYHPRITTNPGNFATPGHYSNGVASWGEVTQITNPDNSWIVYKYDDDPNHPALGIGTNPAGWLTEQMTPFQSNAAVFGESSNVATYFSYDASLSGNGQAADPMNLLEQPRRVQTQLEGIITADVFNRYGAAGASASGANNQAAVITRRATAAGANDKWSAAVFQTQNTITNSSGLKITSQGFAGNSTSNTTVDAGKNLNTSVTSSWGDDTLSSQTETINPFDNALSATDGTIDQPYVADTESNPDAFGNYSADSQTGGVSTAATYPNTANFWFGASSVTEKDGSHTSYTYNAMGEIATKTIYVGTAHSVAWSYVHDLAGHVISMKTQSASDSGLPAVTNTYQYDALGRLRKEIDNQDGSTTDPTHDRTTTYAWTYSGSKRQNILTITHPDGGTEIDTFNLDGSKASVAGTAAAPATYAEGITFQNGLDANNHADSNVTLGSTWSSVTANGANNTTTTYVNLLGEQYLTQQNTPGTNSQHATTVDVVTLFDLNGRPTAVSQYDDQHTLTTQTLTVYDPVSGQAGASVVDMNLNGVYDPGTSDRKTVQKLAPAQSSAGTPVTDDSQDISSSGIDDSAETDTLDGSGSDVSESDNGAVTDTKTPPPSNGGWVTTTTNPDQTRTVDTYADGLLVKEQQLGTDGTTDIVGPTTYTYNGLRELTSKTDYTGTTNYTYFQDGTQASVQTPGHAAQSVQSIDPATNASTQAQRPDGGQVKTPQNLFGQTTAQTGPGLLSANLGYENTTGSQTGNLSSLTTFQGATSLSGGTLSGSGSATTSWAYDPNTGLLKSKTYADGTSDKYQYNSLGQLINLIEPGITASHFTYNAAGEQSSASYTDSITGTVSSSVTPDDMGRPAVVSDTDNGVTTSEVNLFNANNQPYQSIFASSLAQVQYDYYPTSGFGAAGSPMALSTLSIQSLTGNTLASTTYGYSSQWDSTSKRLGTITLPGTNPVTIQYQYFTDTNAQTVPDASDQVSFVQVTSPGTSGLSLTYQRDTATGGNKGRITSVSASANGGSFSAVAVGSPLYNQQDQLAGQRITQPAIGTQASRTDTWAYAYDPNQADALTGATDTPTIGTGTTYAYSYDGVGNRTGTSLGTANSVNEYSNLTYNQRGDLTSDGTYKYGYDALDRLISITPISPISTSTQEQYGYDSQGRRLWKDVYTWNTTSSSWVYSYGRDYVWDGNNLAAELDGSGNLVLRYVYGPTGLIAEQDYPADPNYAALISGTGDPSGQPVTMIAVSDLSGNVDELIDAHSGNILGEFRYDPWGNVTNAAGPATALDGFRGKGYFVDAEAPNIGESPQPGGGMPHAFNFKLQIWMQRDRAGAQNVINESGGAFGNDPINNVDPNGLAAAPISGVYRGPSFSSLTPGSVLYPGDTIPTAGDVSWLWGPQGPNEGDTFGGFTLYNPTWGGKFITSLRVTKVKDERTFYVARPFVPDFAAFGPLKQSVSVGQALSAARQGYDVEVRGDLIVHWTTDPDKAWDTIHFMESTLTDFVNQAHKLSIDAAGFTGGQVIVATVGMVVGDALKILRSLKSGTTAEAGPVAQGEALVGDARSGALADGEVPLGTPFDPERHNLVASLYLNGKLNSQQQFVSGGITSNEMALAQQQSLNPTWRIGDTENRAMRAIDLQPGDRLVLDGQFAPCPTCQAAMVARSMVSGAEIQYRYLDAAGNIRIWSAQNGGNIYAGY